MFNWNWKLMSPLHLGVGEFIYICIYNVCMCSSFIPLFIYSLSRSLGLTETSSVNDPQVQEKSFIQPYRICKRSYSPVYGPCKCLCISIYIYHPVCGRYNPYIYGYQPYPLWGILRFIVFARCARELGEEDTRRPVEDVRILQLKMARKKGECFYEEDLDSEHPTYISITSEMLELGL